MKTKRFDLCMAYWTFASLHHGGQGSEIYRYLSRLSKMGFNPRGTADYDKLEPFGQVVYDRLCERHGIEPPVYVVDYPEGKGFI